VTNGELSELAGAGFERFRISNWDQSLFLVREYDLEAQLIAIRGVLRQNREAEERVAEAIKSLDAQIREYAGGNREYLMHMENHWVDTLHGTVFQDAAHSMSAVGMLAPFLESLLVSIFAALQERFKEAGITVSDSIRGPSSTAKFWSPNYYFENAKWKKGIVVGTRQLSDTVGLTDYLPADFGKTQDALTAYRNVVFHNGFEWPIKERQRFEALIKDRKWPSDWFLKSESGEKPWIFYMGGDFIEHSLMTIDRLLDGVGRYLEERRKDGKYRSNFEKSSSWP
jgi:hypothetical protein